MNSDEHIWRKQITQLDEALHGQTFARDVSPQECWESLLDEVRSLKDWEGAIKNIQRYGDAKP